jgi:hypothetical protein
MDQMLGQRSQTQDRITDGIAGREVRLLFRGLHVALIDIWRNVSELFGVGRSVVCQNL